MSYKMKLFWDKLSGMILKHLTRELSSWQMGETHSKTLPVYNKWPKWLHLNV